MKIFFDTEFTGLHKGTTLISLGMIAEDGKKFYAEFNDYDKSQVNDWIRENVIKHLSFPQNEYMPKNHINNCTSYACKSNTSKIKDILTVWLNQFDEVELVSDCAHYDMVLFINIFGTAFDLPKNVCSACYDLNQDIAKFHEVNGHTAFDINREEILRTHDITVQGKKHNALYDAKVMRALYNILNKED